MNNKGFAITGILYSILVLFIVLVALLLFSLQNKKIILDRMKEDTSDLLENGLNESTDYKIDASEVELNLDGIDASNVADALDDLYEKSN